MMHFVVGPRLKIIWYLIGWIFKVNAEFTSEISQCSDSNLTTYLRTENLLTNEMPLQILTELTLNECAKKCTESEKSCHSFEYNAARQSCALKLANAQPFGRAVLIPSTQPGIAFFQQICIPTKNLCAAPYSFERFPQRVLAGHAMEVISVDNLSTCLRECLEARERMHLDCRSVMYYYESGQCILNRDQRKTIPPSLFSSDTKYQLVDYFENNCFDVSCPENFNIHFIRMEDFEISPDKDVIMDGLSADECKQSCVKNVVGTEVFPCKAYVYSSGKRECRLSAETGMIPNNSTRKSSGTGISSELSSISAGQYFEKFCIEGNVKCKESSFDLIPNRILDARDKVIVTSSLSYCLKQCLMMAEDCNSAMFFKDRDECIINKKSQFSDPDLFHSAKKVDYFDNVCEYEVRPTKILPEFAQQNDIKNDIKEVNGESSERKTTKTKPMFKPDQPIKHHDQKGLLDTDCRLDGISVGAHFDVPSSGAIFVKDHSSTCRKVFENATSIKLELPFPSSSDNNPKCPGSELSPSLWSFIVVLQKNEIGIPSLMTGTDRIFNVTCDYSNITSIPRDNKKSEPIDDTPKVGFDMESGPLPASERIKMSILRNNHPVTTVSLGEELELRWTIDERARRGPDDELLGFLVEDCTAERMDGSPPEPSPLPLIVGGCPDIRVKNRLIRGPIVEVPEGFSTTLKVFRFDGSRRVRIRCSINICVEKCEPVNCDEGSDPNSSTTSTSSSFGRKRRKKRQTIKELAELVEQYDQMKTDGLVQRKLNQGETIDQSMAQGSFTIVDEPESLVDKRSKLLDVSQPLASISTDSTSSEGPKCEGQEGNKLCLRRSLAIGLLIGVIVLGCSQMFWFVNWLQSKVLPPPVPNNIGSHSNISTLSKSSYGSYFEKDAIRWEHDKSAFSTLESPSNHSRSGYLPQSTMH